MGYWYGGYYPPYAANLSPTNPRYRLTRVVAPAPSLALVELDEVKAMFGIADTDTSQDVLLQAQIDSVSAAIDNYCSRTFVRQTYRDQLRNASHWLKQGSPIKTRQSPIPTDDTGAPVLAISENGAALDPALFEVELGTGELYRLDSMGNMGFWCSQLIAVDYDAGFDTIPPDVRIATLEWLNARWMARGRDPAIRSEAVFDVLTVTYADPSASNADSGVGPPDAVCGLLNPYRVWSM
jgi:hypothetical protein